MRKLGAIADDFTGATDLASVLAAEGRNVVVAFGEDPRPQDPSIDAVVIALKTRTAPVADAVRATRAAARALRAWGAEQFYFKYCSTFDSTAEGNIGPAIDALLEDLDLKTALAAPAYPANGRTVYQGHLFVGHQRLDESPMRHHPLTPMRDSHLGRLLAPQTDLPTVHLFLDAVRAGSAELSAALAGTGERRIVVADAIADDDLRALARAAGPDALLTGGAGLGLGLGSGAADPATRFLPHGAPDGHRLVVSGSASAMTRAQVAHARERMPARKLDLARLAAGDDLVPELTAWVAEQWQSEPASPALIYATDSLDDLHAIDPTARELVSAGIEHTLASVARASLAHGLGALLVAGGETSGQVVQTLGIDAIQVGPEIAPGVVWAEATAAGAAGGPARIAIALKSGNFGDETLFASAWDTLR